MSIHKTHIRTLNPYKVNYFVIKIYWEIVGGVTLKACLTERIVSEKEPGETKRADVFFDGIHCKDK